MVCVYCGHDDSRVYNSRTRNQGRSVWRRRRCPNCKAAWTTHEEISIDSTYRVNKNGALMEFDRAILFCSLYESLKHRENAPKEAEALTQTIILHLQKQNNALLDTATIKLEATAVLSRFDQLAGQLYATIHPISKT